MKSAGRSHRDGSHGETRAGHKHSGVLMSAGLCLLLAAITIIAFMPLWKNDFVNFDDPRYITANPYITEGITVKSIKWAFTKPYANNWHPLTWLSHMADYQLFGLDPRGHHAVNLCLHIFNVLLLFLLLGSMTGAVWPCFFAAAAFAVHPLHVESVAWVSERKDVLSAFFWLLTMWSYASYARLGGVLRYAWVIIFFSLGLLSKPMLVTLPFVLLLLDYWPLGRMGRGTISPPVRAVKSQAAKGGFANAGLIRVIIEKLPLLFLAAISAVITYVVQQKTGAMRTWDSFPLDIRISNALASYFVYLYKMFWPISLAVLYPHPVKSLAPAVVALLFAALLLLTVLFCYAGRRRGWFFTGWFWYLGTLVPVIGIVQVGVQSRADRYTYIPLIGIFILISWAAAELSERKAYKKAILSAGALAIVAMVILTYRQAGLWRDSISLYEHTLSVTENNYAMHNNYGSTLAEKFSDKKITLAERGRLLLQAIEHFRKCLAINPGHANAEYNLGLALMQKSDIDGALRHLRRSLELDPSSEYTYINLAGAMLMSKEPQYSDGAESVRLAEKACEITNWSDADMVSILSHAYAKNQRMSDAFQAVQKAENLYRNTGMLHEAELAAQRKNAYRAIIDQKSK